MIASSCTSSDNNSGQEKSLKSNGGSTKKMGSLTIESVFNEQVTLGQNTKVVYEGVEYSFQEILDDSGKLIGYVNENQGAFGVGDLRSSGVHRYVDLVENKEYLFNLHYNAKYNKILPDFEEFSNNEIERLQASKPDQRCMANFMLCCTTATLAAIAVAASDGPLPFMDAVAATTYVAAHAYCVSSYDLCIHPPKN